MSTSIGAPSPLATLSLHDATLVQVTLGWDDATCIAEVRGEVSPGWSGASLKWVGVAAFEFSRHEPWGPSVSILEARNTHGWDEIILQSGDVLRVRADALQVERLTPAG